MSNKSAKQVAKKHKRSGLPRALLESIERQAKTLKDLLSWRENLVRTINEALGQLFKNERVMADMGYTNNIRIAVIMRLLKEIPYYQSDGTTKFITQEDIDKYVEEELAERRRIDEETKKKRLDELKAKEEAEKPEPPKEGDPDFIGPPRPPDWKEPESEEMAVEPVEPVAPPGDAPVESEPEDTTVTPEVDGPLVFGGDYRKDGDNAIGQEG